jgi:hypothetical protein
MMQCRGMGKMKPTALKKGGTVKDACYNKVKATAKVFPSAYASGRIAQCRKRGAENYGKSSRGAYNAKN